VFSRGRALLGQQERKDSMELRGGTRRTFT